MRNPGENHDPRHSLELFGADRWQKLADHLGLPPRQRQIALLVCRSFGDRQIGLRLGISEHTVHSHLRALFERLDVNDRIGVTVRLVLVDRELSNNGSAPPRRKPDLPV